MLQERMNLGLLKFEVFQANKVQIELRDDFKYKVAVVTALSRSISVYVLKE